MLDLGVGLFGACKDPPNTGHCLGKFVGKFLQTLIYGYLFSWCFVDLTLKFSYGLLLF